MYSSVSGLYCTKDGGDNWTFITNNFPRGDFILNFAPGLAWTAETWDGSSGGTIFELFDANHLEDNPIQTCSANYGSPDGFIAYAFNEQLYFTNSSGVLLYTLNNCGYTDIKQNNFSSNIGISIFPNPAKNLITINFESPVKNGDYKITIYDLLGTVVYEKSYRNQNNLTIDVSNLLSGLYTIIISNNNESQFSRFIKL